MEKVEQGRVWIMISADDLEELKKGQRAIAEALEAIKKSKPEEKPKLPGYLSPVEFMQAVKIKRWKFNQLIHGNKIKAIKKTRKIYIPVSEVERYFSDPKIQ